MHKLALFPLLMLLSPLVCSTNHDITVGPHLSFTPNTTIASPGDTLTFYFYPGNHNVAQGDFAKPCEFLPGGFYSGFINPLEGEANETFVVTVNNTDPIWYYCSEYMHCQHGMVGVVNPPVSGDSLSVYAATAADKINSTTPPVVGGGVFSVQSRPGSTSTSAALPLSTSSTSSSPTKTSDSTNPKQSSSQGVVVPVFGGGKTVLSAFGAVVALGILETGLI